MTQKVLASIAGMLVVGSLVTGPGIRVHANDGAGTVVRPVIVVRDRYPAWSPDGDRIVFDSTRTSTQEIFVLDVDDPRPKQLTRLGRSSRTPVFSPDGEWVAFASSEESSSQAIYVMRPDGSEMKQVTDPPQEGTSEEKATINDSHPKWAPDGESLVFNRDGSEPRNISNHPSFDGYPAWLPESEGIVFASNRNGDSRFDFNLYVMRPDGSAETRLTETIPGVLQVRPQVSPNGTSIAFNRDHFNGEEDETTRIYIARFHRPISELMRTEEE